MRFTVLNGLRTAHPANLTFKSLGSELEMAIRLPDKWILAALGFDMAAIPQWDRFVRENTEVIQRYVDHKKDSTRTLIEALKLYLRKHDVDGKCNFNIEKCFTDYLTTYTFFDIAKFPRLTEFCQNNDLLIIQAARNASLEPVGISKTVKVIAGSTRLLHFYPAMTWALIHHLTGFTIKSSERLDDARLLKVRQQLKAFER